MVLKIFFSFLSFFNFNNNAYIYVYIYEKSHFFGLVLVVWICLLAMDISIMWYEACILNLVRKSIEIQASILRLWAALKSNLIFFSFRKRRWNLIVECWTWKILKQNVMSVNFIIMSSIWKGNCMWIDVKKCEKF